MGSKKHGQSAMEFLMTYGWAILIIVIVIAVLFYMGVINPKGMQQDTCMFEPGISCYAFKTGNETGALEIDMGQATGKSIDVTSISCSQEDTPTLYPLTNDVTIPSGEHRWVVGGDSGNIVYCTDANGGNLSVEELQYGERYKGTVCIGYTELDTGVERTTCGDISASLSPGGQTTGGGCSPNCNPGSGCSGGSQCGSGYCDNGTCQECLGPDCPDGTVCTDGSICESQFCQGVVEGGCGYWVDSDDECATGGCCQGPFSCLGGACQTFTETNKIGICSNGTTCIAPTCHTKCEMQATEGDCEGDHWCAWTTPVNGRCFSCTSNCPEGYPCTDASECASGYCPSGACEACTADCPDGAACSSSGMCDSGFCGNGRCKPLSDSLGFTFEPDAQWYNSQYANGSNYITLTANLSGGGLPVANESVTFSYTASTCRGMVEVFTTPATNATDAPGIATAIATTPSRASRNAFGCDLLGKFNVNYGGLSNESYYSRWFTDILEGGPGSECCCGIHTHTYDLGEQKNITAFTTLVEPGVSTGCSSTYYFQFANSTDGPWETAASEHLTTACCTGCGYWNDYVFNYTGSWTARYYRIYDGGGCCVDHSTVEFTYG